MATGLAKDGVLKIMASGQDLKMGREEASGNEDKISQGTENNRFSE